MIERRTYLKGETIIRESDYGEEIYILDRGEVEVSTGSGESRTVLGVLGAGEIFGEMAVIDEKPRSATVTTLQSCRVKVLHRDQFMEVLQQDREISVKILRSLFNRLRRANLRSAGPVQESSVQEPAATGEKEPSALVLEGMTREASEALPEIPFSIGHFPFVVGRVTSDPFAQQDLALRDSKPFQISRHHLVFEREAGAIYATDMGSKLGFQVGSERFGGRESGSSIRLEDGEVLQLGGAGSGFRYRVRLG